MDKPVIICGGPDIEARTRTYLQLVGRRQVSVASQISEFSEAIVDVRGGLASKRLIPSWQQRECTVISNGPPARTLAQSQDLLNRGNLLLTLPSLYDHRYQLLQKQVAEGAIGDVITIRLIRLLSMQSPLWDSIVLTYGLDPLATLQALGGSVGRIMAREQNLRRRRSDTLFAVGRFESGAIFYLELSAICPYGYHSERIEVVGTRGLMEYNSDLNHSLRLTTAEGSTLHNALYEPPLFRMLREYLRCVDDPSMMDEHRDRAQTALELLFRVIDSAQAHEPR